MRSGEWDDYLLATAGLFFFLADRFDNRFVLSMALSSLAAWFGLTISPQSVRPDEVYREYAVLYSVPITAAAWVLQRLELRKHFLGTYLNIASPSF
jgi:hypothetical protein